MAQSKPVRRASKAVSGIDVFWEALNEDYLKGNKYPAISERTGKLDPDADGGISVQTLRRFHQRTLQNLSHRQLNILAKMYDISISIHEYDQPGFWNAMSNPEQSARLIEVREKHETKAEMVYGYAEFLPCSYETKEFMESHHAALFRNVEFSNADARQNLVRSFNFFGETSQRRFHSSTRRWIFRHMMYGKTLREIAKGRGVYSNIEEHVRIECLTRLRDGLNDSNNRMELTIAEDPQPSFDEYLPGADSLFVTDNKLAVWRTRFGSVYWVEHPAEVNQLYELLATFHERAAHNSNESAITFLEELIKN
jgi:hypothetical protein